VAVVLLAAVVAAEAEAAGKPFGLSTSAGSAIKTALMPCDGGHSRKMILHGYLRFVEVAMKFTRALIGLFALLLSGAAITLVSQEKSSPTHANYTYAPTSEQTMRGWVVETRDFQCPVTGTVGSHITVKNETGSIEVHLAPASFMKQYEINIRKGDNVTVVGSKIMFEGKGALIAKSVAIGNETYNFRDQSGRPLW
jgi:hypothetical protein